MNQTELDPIARIIRESYLTIPEYVEWSKATFEGCVPTRAAQAHHMRSVVQNKVVISPSLKLGGDYTEFGRVQVTQLATGRTYVLKSMASLTVKQAVRGGQQLFSPARFTRADAFILVYDFTRTGVDLSVTGAVRVDNRFTLHPDGRPTFVATWLWDDTTTSFDQTSDRGVFDQIGQIDLEAEEEGS